MTSAPRKPLLIGLIGRAGAGKSTVARMLEDEFAFVELALADPIFNMVGSLFADANIDGAWMVERSLKECPTALGYSYRHLAQTLGTEWGRNTISQDFWLRVLELRMTQPHLEAENICVSDIRFPNEAALIKSRGGTLVRVLRQGVNAVRAHASEQYDLPADTELLNFGSKATLFDQVDRLVTTLRKP